MEKRTLNDSLLCLTALYESFTGNRPATVEPLPASGSSRRYFRFPATDSHRPALIGCIGTSVEENDAFCALSRLFTRLSLPVPAVYAVSTDHLCYLQQDLGSLSLFDALRAGRESGGHYGGEEVRLLEQTMRDLAGFQFRAALCEVYRHGWPLQRMDARSIAFDLNYFKYCYLKLCGTEFNEISLQDDFDRLTSDLLQTPEAFWGFQYRDFQARNVMLTGSDSRSACYIDFQGGRCGPVLYDVASFLWQASSRFSPSLRDHLVDCWFRAALQFRSLDATALRSLLPLFVLFRTLQVLGAYGFRGLWERKPHFINSIPLALDNFRALAAQGTCDAYPTLRQIIRNISDLHPASLGGEETRQEGHPERTFFSPSSGGAEGGLTGGAGSLVVSIFSFSYKHGIPADESGNGGGYVFDCRSTHNPGRYDAYKQLTGLDRPVIQFLEADGEILRFLDHVYALADFHVQRYIDRGFTHLQFAFGCTGGRHRSVYCAQHLAEHLHSRFGIEIRLCHREQGLTTVLPPVPCGERTEGC